MLADIPGTVLVEHHNKTLLAVLLGVGLVGLLALVTGGWSVVLGAVTLMSTLATALVLWGLSPRPRLRREALQVDEDGIRIGGLYIPLRT